MGEWAPSLWMVSSSTPFPYYQISLGGIAAVSFSHMGGRFMCGRA